MAKGRDEHRSARRYNVRNFQLDWTAGGLFSFLGVSGQGRNRLPVVNFSVGGAQFLSAKDLPRGERVRIHLFNPILTEPLALDAEVCWSRQLPRRSAYRVGARFTIGSPHSRDRLQELEARLSDMIIRLRCDGCGTPFSVKKHLEGRAGLCPKCKAIVEVREDEILPQLPEERRAADDKAAFGAPGPAVGVGLPKPIDAFLRSATPSRLHLHIIQHFSKRPAGQVVGVSELAFVVSMPEPRVYAALKEMAAQGILKEIGAKTFNYDPCPDAKRKIAELASLLNNPVRRSEVLAVVLDAEKRGK
jgi:hypothetical protein